MYVYLLAPIFLMLAMIVGWGPRRLPTRAFLYMLGIVVVLGILEYFTGYFPAITWPFVLYMVLLAVIIRGIRILMERSFASFSNFTRNRTLMYIVIAIVVLLALSVFGFGGIITLGFIVLSIYPSLRRRPRGPHPLSEVGGVAGTLETLRKSLNRLGPIAVLIIGTGIALIATSIVSGAATGIAAATTYGEQVALVKATPTTTLPAIQLSDVPIVERDNAAIVLSNAIGSLGPQFHVSMSGLSLVRYQGQLVWTAPLDYNNGLIWLTRHVSPGYVWTSASNPSAKPVMVLNQSYQILPQAGFSYNLSRVLYQHFPTLIIGTSDWELDPTGHGYWVTSLYSPAPGLAGLVTRVIVGSALTDPTTGSTVYYALNKQPAWVSQVVGPNFAQNEAQRYGWDRGGFIASTFTHQLATQPVHQTPYNVLLGNGALGWEIPLTSPNAGDNSLSGLMLINAETNAVTYTPFTGIQNDLAISQRIDGATLNSTLSSGRALLYNISGALGYVAPVVNQSGIVQQVAVVDPKNVSQPIIASSLGDAVGQWQSYLAGAGISGPAPTSEKTVTGTIERVATLLESSGASGAAVKEYWLFLIHGVAYRASLSVNPNVVPFIKPGDRVTITFLPGNGTPTTLDTIKDLSLQSK